MDLRKVASQLKGLSSIRLDLACVEALEGFVKPVEEFMARVEEAEIGGLPTAGVFREVTEMEEKAGDDLYGMGSELGHVWNRIAELSLQRVPSTIS